MKMITDDGIHLYMDDGGIFHEMPKPYMTFAIATKEDWNALLDTVNRGNRMQWVNAKDRLPPKDDGMVLVIVSGKPSSNVMLEDAYELAEYTSDGWTIEMWPEWEGADVKYWMHLPEPPKGCSAE